MTKRINRCVAVVLAAALISLCGCFGGSSACAVSGVVTDAATHRPVQGVSVIIVTAMGETTAAETDENGSFYFTVIQGDYTIKFAKENYIAYTQQLAAQGDEFKFPSAVAISMENESASEEALPEATTAKAATTVPTTAAQKLLSEDEIISLFIKANNLYDGWLYYGRAAQLDYEDNLDGNYARVTGEYSSVAELEAALKECFSEEIYRQYLSDCYIMSDGKLYGVYGLGEGGDIGPNILELTVDVLTNSRCEFTVTGDYNGSEIFKEDYTMELRGGRWIFVGKFAMIDSLYYHNDCPWK